MDDRTVSRVVASLIEVLEPSGESYAFGGAVALAAWSEPRATADVDVVLWIELSRLDRAIQLIESAGVALDWDAARAEAEERGMFVGWAGAVRVDVFVPSISFYEEAEHHRVRTRIAGHDTWVHSAEVLTVFKMLFFRPKDLLDVERILQIRGSGLDRDFVRRALVDMLGEDPRVAQWDALCDRNPVDGRGER
jgi:hypothetical protein